MSIITLTTDFGNKDFFVASVKGAILTEVKNAVVIDISHEIQPYNHSEAAYIIKNAYNNKTMDDSVIKVLRRNGSWEDTKKTQDVKKYKKQDIPKFKNLEEDFHLDEKFEILAEEIKKRMNQRDTRPSKSKKVLKDNIIKVNHEQVTKTNFQDIAKLKSQILPYLRNIERLIIKRQSYLDNISEVDKELDKVYEEISKIKDSYLNTINQIKNSINFFDDSLDIIKIAKEEK